MADQDTFYDVTDVLEEQGMESVIERHMSRKGSGDLDLLEQFQVYESALKHEDGVDEERHVLIDSVRSVPRHVTVLWRGDEKTTAFFIHVLYCAVHVCVYDSLETIAAHDAVERVTDTKRLTRCLQEN